MNKQNKSWLPISARSYFISVAIISLILIALIIYSKPVLVQQLGVLVGVNQNVAASDDSFYLERVEPILKQYCIDCHNEEKTKGGLSFADYLHSRYSGKSGHVIVPYQVKQSLLIERMLLPENDKRLMPPLGWDHPTEAEHKVLELWIERGASATLIVADFPGVPELVVEVKIPVIDFKAVDKSRAATAEVVKQLQAEFPFALNYVSRDGNSLRFTNVSLSSRFDDQALKKLQPIAKQLTSLYLRNAPLTDNSAAILVEMENIQQAFLHGSKLSEKVLLEIIEHLPKLTHLTLDKAHLTDSVIAFCQQHNINIRGA